jgi:PAS domain S-box-containing protein
MRLEDKVLAQMTEVAFVIDGQGRYSYISPSIRHYGIEPAEMIGKPGIQFLHADDVGKVRGLMRDLLAGRIDHAADREYRVILPNGRTLWVEGRPSLLFDDRGDPVGYLTMLRDVTARREAADQAVEETARRLFNHDVRTPLNGILAASELLLETAGPSSDKTRTLTADIVQSARALREALRTFLGPDATPFESREPTAPAPQPAAPRRLRVLAADDQPINLHLIDAILEPIAEVIMVQDGREALTAFEAALRADPFDSVLVDVQMPLLDGLETVRAIRSLGPAARATPIIMVTANAAPEDEQASLDAGADLHMTKPIRPHALLATVKQYAHRAGS